MTLQEKITSTAYTGINFCRNEKEFEEFQKYVTMLMHRPIQTFEMADRNFWNELKALAEPDFGEMLKTDSSSESEWTPLPWYTSPQTKATKILVTTVNFKSNNKDVKFAYFSNSKGWWMPDERYDDRITAWREVPAPYMGDDE